MRSRLDYKNKLILAPMVKIGTLPTRLLALEYGADIVYTEEIIDHRLLNSRRIQNPILDTVDYVHDSDETLVLRISPKERGHLVLQIGTSDPCRAAKVARKVWEDVDGIDVNMGCPKPFSMKGGMGAALLSQPQRAKSILTALVSEIGDKIPVTCKIRVLSNLDQTLELVKVIQSTGISALAVHGRTKDERSNHENRTDVIKEIKSVATVPIIANGGSSNNRDSHQNTYKGIIKFWNDSGADSVMIARAAEWNVSVFSNVKQDIYKIIDQYLEKAIHFDYPFAIVKYNIQQILGSDQDTVKGRKFLGTGSMFDLCDVFEKGTAYAQRQKEISILKNKHSVDERENIRTGLIDEDPTPKKQRLSSSNFPSELVNSSVSENEEVNVMFAPFIRTRYSYPTEIPKARLLSWYRTKTGDNDSVPAYHTVRKKDKVFQSIVRLGDYGSYSSSASEKNKKYSEQAAALVALHCLDIYKLSNNPSER